MKALRLSDQEELSLVLQDEIRRSSDARYDHRLHAVLLVAQGISCRQVGALLGESHGTVCNWIHRFEESGLAGLNDQQGRGRPRRQTERKQVEAALQRSPAGDGPPAQLWDGPLRPRFVENQTGMTLRMRQRLYRSRSLRLCQLRPQIAPAADRLEQGAAKETLCIQ